MRKISFAAFSILLVMLVFSLTACGGGNTPTPVSSSPPAVKAGAPAKLAFITQPDGATAGSALSTQPAIAVQDADGKTVTNSILAIKVTITSGTGTGGAALLGPSTLNAVNGVVKCNNLIIDKAGTGYTLTASSGNLAPAVSAPFTVSPGAPARLAFTVQPSGGTAGVPFTTQPEITVQDHYGNKVTDYQGSVTVGITYISGPSGSVLSGKTTVDVVNSVARFTDLSINRTYPEYKLTATSGSLDSVNSELFGITAAKPAKLEFTVEPNGAKAGQPFDTQPKVAIVDTFGNVVTQVKDPITIAITPGTGTAGAALSGTTIVKAEGGLGGGLSEYEDLSIDLAGTGYTLTASCNSLTPAISDAFKVAAP
jgi:hypothetical protein